MLCNPQEILAPPPTYPHGKPFPLMCREILSEQSEIRRLKIALEKEVTVSSPPKDKCEHRAGGGGSLAGSSKSISLRGPSPL